MAGVHRRGASDLHLAPSAELASGAWQLLYIQDATKCELIDGFLTKLGDGTRARAAYS
jgi:hypothetical protein